MSDYIPTEIVNEILRFVPVESLFRFRSVCKSWCSTIDDPTFSKHHIHRGIGQDSMFHIYQSDSKHFLLPIKKLVYSSKRSTRLNATNVKVPCGRLVSVLPACNGLILLTYSKPVWVICNPFTGESLEIVTSREIANNINSGDIGLGYDKANDDYVVVTIIGFHTYLYSMNSEEWRRIGDFPGLTIVQGRGAGVFAYGALHWVGFSEEQQGDVWWIAALDVSTRNYRKIAIPSEITRKNYFQRHMQLNEWSGCLLLSCSNFNNRHFVMWMINDYGCENQWVKMISLEDGSYITPVAYFKSEDKVLLYKKGEQYLWYDVGKKCLQKLRFTVHENGVKKFGKKYVYYTYSSRVFPASLICLKKNDESVSSQGTPK